MADICRTCSKRDWRKRRCEGAWLDNSSACGAIKGRNDCRGHGITMGCTAKDPVQDHKRDTQCFAGAVRPDTETTSDDRVRINVPKTKIMSLTKIIQNIR